MSRNIYLKMKTLAEARTIVTERLAPLRRLSTETVPVPEAVGRVLAAPVFAALSAPSYHAAAMDGIAVKADSTYGASEVRPKTLAVGREAFFVNTGNALPENTDAVIMIENVQMKEESCVQIEAPAYPWQHVRKIGEDIVATELLFPRHHKVTPYCVGALLTGGVFSVPVFRKPRVLIIPTGSELADWRTASLAAFRPGQVLETNSFVLGGLVEACGGTFTRHAMVPDHPSEIKAAVEHALSENFDLVMIIGGSSAGSEDYARAVLDSLGEVLVHGVTIMPGKPAVIGSARGVPVFGIPGYPVSAIIVFEQLVRLLLTGLLGQPEKPPETATVEPTRKMASKLGLEEFVRVKLGEVNGRIVATPLPRGAGSITSITEADGIIRIPADTEGIRENEPVTAELLKPLSELRRTIVIVGSHDNTLDVLADQLKAAHGRLSLCSSHVGSMGGLMAIKRGACHIAGSHLLDSADGTYNISYIRKYLPGRSIKLVNLVYRDNGLIVRRGNPKAIRGIEDLTRPEVTFINRQGGSGTRILLDYRLKQLGIDPAAIPGYGTEEFTHMSVAVAVLSGSADAGLGIYAAAKALGLDFIPVVTETYDLVIPAEHYGTENIGVLLDIIASAEFKHRVEALGGYSTRHAGETIDILP
ncbi:MAG: molybdopterin biosynthesis protein [Hyphomicrobiales bacterium]